MPPDKIVQVCVSRPERQLHVDVLSANKSAGSGSSSSSKSTE